MTSCFCLLRLTFGYWNKKVLSSLALTSLGLADESEDGTLYHFGSLYSASKVLRLSFHDCLKYSDGTGGCDGCLDWKGVGKYYEDAPGEQLYEDVRLTDNNGLRPTVEVLEAVYTVADFPPGAPVLARSLPDSGKSRADLWSLAAIVAVEWGVETNNIKCDDSDAVRGCHHLQGEPGCHVLLNRSIPFRKAAVSSHCTAFNFSPSSHSILTLSNISPPYCKTPALGQVGLTVSLRTFPGLTSHPRVRSIRISWATAGRPSTSSRRTSASLDRRWWPSWALTPSADSTSTTLC